MKRMLSTLRTHLAGGSTTTAMCWLTVRRDGTVLAVTEHDRNLSFNLAAAITALGLTPLDWITAAGTKTYLAASGFTSRDIASGSGLNVDTGEAQGMLMSPGITAADMMAGLWDFADICIFVVNWADLTMGCYIDRCGSIGEINTDRGFFRAEWRGVLQYYQSTIGRLTLPACDAVLGDARCKKDLTAFTVTSTLTGALSDRVTLYDTTRAEAGPTGGTAILGITNANPGVVTMASGTGFTNGMPVSLSHIVGPSSLNTTTFIRSLSGASWALGVDTSNTSLYPAYVGSGIVTPLGGTMGYFSLGRIRFTTGANANGRWYEIKDYVPGQFVLQLPLPYAPVAGDAYQAIAGCDQSLVMCRDTYDNILNNRGLYYLPGIDKIVQIGRRT